MRKSPSLGAGWVGLAPGPPIGPGLVVPHLGGSILSLKQEKDCLPSPAPRAT